MPSLLQRADSAVKAWNNPQLNKPNAMKYSGGGWSLFDSLGGTSSRTGNIIYSENGAAQAYGAVTGVQAAVRFYMDAIGLLKLQVKSTDDVLWDSTQPVPKDGNAFEGATLVIAMHDYRLQYFHDYLSSVIFSDMLYAETYTYVQPHKQSFGINTALRWLNPLAITPNIMQGSIRDYRYSGQDGYATLPPNEIAYRIYNRNPFDDNRGLSRVLSALDAINIERNAKKAIGNFFSNGMILGGVASPSNQDEHLMTQEIKRFEDDLRRNNSGTHNAHKWIVAPVNLNFEQFEADTMDKHYDIVKSTRTEVMMVLGVPKELVGDSEGVSYENAEPVMKNWLKIQGRAYATSQLDYINLDLLPMFESSSDAMFSYDFSVIDRRDADKVVIELNSGIITLDDASVELGKESDSDIADADIRIINGVPYSKKRLLAVANGEVPLVTLPSNIPPPPELEATIETPVQADKHVHNHNHDLNVAKFEPNHDTPEQELKAWSDVIFKNHKRTFAPVHLRGDLGDTIQLGLDTAKSDRKAIRAVFGDATKALATKAIQATRLQFEDNFDNLLKRARDEKMTRSSWSASMRKIIRSSGKKAFSDGLIDFGVLDGIPSEEDQDEIARLITEQSPHVTVLGDVLYKQDGITDDLADIKAAMWYVKSIAPFYDAGRLSANGNQMVEFAGDDGEDSCNTCQRLDGQRHRFKDFVRKGLRPGVDTENFDCGGWECNHKLVPVKAKARGRL